METKLVYKLIANVAKKINAISKDRDNKHQNYKFRGIDDVYNELHVPMSEEGLFSFPRVLERNEEIFDSKSGARTIRVILKIEYVFCAHDGSELVIGPIFMEAMDTSDKATNKALSVAHKYVLMQTFAIPTDDPKDPEVDHIELAHNSTQKDKVMHQPNNYATKHEAPKTSLSAPFTRPATQAAPSQAKASKLVTEAQVKRLYAIHEKAGWSFENVTKKMKELFNKMDVSQLNMTEYDELISFIQLTKPDSDSLPFWGDLWIMKK